MAKMSMRVILKSGAEFTVKCDKFTLERNGLEQVTGYNIGGITENKPVYLDFDEVAAIVRVVGRSGRAARRWRQRRVNGKRGFRDGQEKNGLDY